MKGKCGQPNGKGKHVGNTIFLKGLMVQKKQLLLIIAFELCILCLVKNEFQNKHTTMILGNVNYSVIYSPALL